MTRPAVPSLTVPLVHTPRRQFGVFGTLDELESSWDGLAAGSGSPMHHYAWVSACADGFSDPANLCVVLVGSPRRPAALAPLVRRSDGRARLELLGIGELHEPTDLIYKDPAAAEALASAVACLGLPLFLPRIAADSITLDAIRKSWSGGMVIARPALGSPFIELDDSWAQPEAPLKAKRRSDLRRARRHAEDVAPVTCRILSPTPDELDDLLDQAFQVEGANWKGRHGTALATDAAQSTFYRRYARRAAQAGMLRVCFLRIGDHTAAVQLAVESEERFWLLKIGYDETFARCSPGMLLLAETVRHAAQRGLRSYEFLGAPEPWIQMWTDQVRPCVSIRAYPARPSGITALAADMAQAGRRKIGRLLTGSL